MNDDPIAAMDVHSWDGVPDGFDPCDCTALEWVVELEHRAIGVNCGLDDEILLTAAEAKAIANLLRGVR